MTLPATATAIVPEPPPPSALLGLEPGDYYLELHTSARCTPEVLAEGLRRLGFANVTLDAPARAAKLTGSLRAVVRLGAPIAVRNTPTLAWQNARRLRVDPFKKPRLTLDPVPLLPEALYETLFFSRVVRKKDAEKHAGAEDVEREVVIERLAEMGWETDLLAAIKRDTRVDGRTGASVTLWFGLLRWTGPESMVTDDEPVSFEDVIPV